MQIDLVISTHNRSTYLNRAIASFITQEMGDPSDSVAIVIVDNNSTDDTRQVVEGFIRQATVPVRYIFEAKEGLSYARNAAIAVSRADVIVFMDDDAYADTGWLDALVTVYKETDAACVGGKIDLDWESPRPTWLPDNLLYYLAYLDYGNQTILLNSHKLIPYGANISFRKSILDKVGSFNVSLGRKGKIMLDAEEVELCSRIRKAGGQIWYTPEALVFHTVSPQRLTKKYFTNISYWKGRSGARVSLQRDGLIPAFLRAIKRSIKLPINTAAGILFSLTGNPACSFYHVCESRIDFGYITEFFNFGTKDENRS